MTSPYAGNTDRIDLMWAVVGDTACATFEQLRRLRELSGHSRKYILACGGGFRSGTLCQMIADLTGLELRLQTGYEQATLQGLIRICNEAVREADRALLPTLEQEPPGGKPGIDFGKRNRQNTAENFAANIHQKETVRIIVICDPDSRKQYSITKFK